MLLSTYAHQLDIEHVSPAAQAALSDLQDVSEAMPYLFWPDKSEKLLADAGLTSHKERQLRQQESLQSLYNVWLRQALVERGFDAEFAVRDARQSADGQKVDFAKLVEHGKRVYVEVEFGYTASIERNLFKLLDAYHHGRSALGVMICPHGCSGQSDCGWRCHVRDGKRTLAVVSCEYVPGSAAAHWSEPSRSGQH